jgi:Tol biopolymer transport system component
MVMIRGLIASTAVVTIGIGLGLPAVGVTAMSPPTDAAIQGDLHRGHGVLRVKMVGTGKYTVIGHGIRKTAHKTRSFALAPGTYTVKALAGDPRVTRIRVRRDQTRRVTVVFDQGSLSTGVVRRVSTASDGGEGNWSSLAGFWSPDGTQVLIISKATNLVPEPDVNGEALDLYVKTLATDEMVRVSTNSQGEQGNNGSTFASWSPDGTKILFDSMASNLVPNDTNDAPDVFVKDLTTGAVERVSTDAKGQQVHGSQSNVPSWSPDGTRVAFDSYAPDLVPNDTNADKDVFVKTLATGAIQRISVDSKGRQCAKDSRFPTWSPDGRRVMFSSSCALVPDDTNRSIDAYVKTLSSGKVERVSTSSSGRQGNRWSLPDGWSSDGTRVSFISESTDLVPDDTNKAEDVFVKNLATGQLQRVSTDAQGGQASKGSANSMWSPDGKQIAFTSAAPDLVAADTNGLDDAFVKTLASGDIQRVSVTSEGEQGNGDTMEITWSPDGDQTLIVSFANNFVPDDTNDWFDVFIANAR